MYFPLPFPIDSSGLWVTSCPLSLPENSPNFASTPMTRNELTSYPTRLQLGQYGFANACGRDNLNNAMTIHLLENLERYAYDQVQAGHYLTEDDLIRDALERHRQA
jgi:hypothetical protein